MTMQESQIGRSDVWVCGKRCHPLDTCCCFYILFSSTTSTHTCSGCAYTHASKAVPENAVFPRVMLSKVCRRCDAGFGA